MANNTPPHLIFDSKCSKPEACSSQMQEELAIAEAEASKMRKNRLGKRCKTMTEEASRKKEARKFLKTPPSNNKQRIDKEGVYQNSGCRQRMLHPARFGTTQKAT